MHCRVFCLQSGRFHVDRYVYRFDPVELREGRARRRRRSADTDSDDHRQYRMSTSLLEHDQHLGALTSPVISCEKIL